MSGWYLPRPDGVLIMLRVTPNAGRDAIDGVEQRADGSPVLKLRVSAPPDKGRANAAVIALIAKALDVPRTRVTVHRGETTRNKTLHIAQKLEEIAPRLAQLAA